MSAGDSAWMLASTALVFLMTPGLAFFYGGLVRRKNTITTMLEVFSVLILISIQWVLFGYHLAFGTDFHHIIGNLSWIKTNALFHPSAYAKTLPTGIFAIFQMTFAIITPALIVGGLAERVKFSSFVVFTLAWSTFIYDPLAHWVWGNGGWLRNLGLLDFAGGTVVHISSGVAGLVAALYFGKRSDHGSHIRAHNVPLVAIGTALLWFGWFGFNAGSALQANSLAGLAFLTTNTATAAAAFGWMLIEKLKTGHVTLVGVCAGAIAGLVAITPAAGFVSPLAALAIGFLGGIICYFASTTMKQIFGYDDALDAFGGHGIGGTWGALATGIFASVGGTGALLGNWHQVWVQLLGIGTTWFFSGIGTLILIFAIDRLMGFRVSADVEKIGLDQSLHDESAYDDDLPFSF